MADANTTRYAIVKPEVGASADTWGAKLNTNLDDLDALLGAITTTGSANAYVLTTGLSLAAYVAGQSFDIKANFTNSGAATINVDTLGAKSITKNGTTALASGDITSGNIYRVSYDGTQFQIIGFIGQPLDATLTAIAALSWSSGSPVIQFTAADTVSLTLTPSLTSIVLGAGSNTAPSQYLSTSTQTGWYLQAANVWGWTAAGTLSWLVSTTQISAQNGGVFLPGNGTVGAPGFGFKNDTDSGWYLIGDGNIGLTIAGTKRADLSATLLDFTVATRAPLAVSSETTGTLTAASSNKQVLMSGDCTINDGVHAANDWIFFSNDAGTTKQIIQDTGMTLRLHGTSTTGTRTIGLRGGAAVRFNSASDATVYGDVT